MPISHKKNKNKRKITTKKKKSKSNKRVHLKGGTFSKADRNLDQQQKTNKVYTFTGDKEGKLRTQFRVNMNNINKKRRQEVHGYYIDDPKKLEPLVDQLFEVVDTKEHDKEKHKILNEALNKGIKIVLEENRHYIKCPEGARSIMKRDNGMCCEEGWGGSNCHIPSRTTRADAIQSGVEEIWE